MLCRCNWLCLKNNNVYLQVCKKKKDWGSFTLSSWWYPTHAMPLSTCRLSMFSPVSQNLKYIFNQLVVGRLRGPESPVSPRHITRDNSHIQRTQLLRKYIELKVYLPYSRSDLMNNEQASDWTGTRSLQETAAARGARAAWRGEQEDSPGEAVHQLGCLGRPESVLGLVALSFCGHGCRRRSRPGFLAFLAQQPGATSPHHLVSENVPIYQDSRNLSSSRSDCEFSSYPKARRGKGYCGKFWRRL